MPTVTAAFVAARFRQKPNTSRARQAFTHIRILGEHTANVKRLYSAIFYDWKDAVENRKDRGEELVSVAAGPDFRTAMIHATITGLEKDESADEGG